MNKSWEVVLYSSKDGRDSVINEIDDFLNISLKTITKGVINEKSGYFWKVDKKNYTFEYVNEPIIRFDSITLICSNIYTRSLV